ncbi:Djp1 [Apiospora aurea]|uniref:Djp1 n=1 Tax=Apiospora aurea TaxID=335848 RepID=A0ABR1PVM7_9PEZI
MDQVQDHYAVLQVPPTASGIDIKKSYHRLVLLTHPDKSPDDPGATKKFQAVSNAYETLRDPLKRAAYDIESRGRQQSLGQDRKPSDEFARTSHTKEDEPTDFKGQDAETCEFWANVLEQELASLILKRGELRHQIQLIESYITEILKTIEVFEEEENGNKDEKLEKNWIAFLFRRRALMEAKASRARQRSERALELLELKARWVRLHTEHAGFAKKIDAIESVITATYRRLLNVQHHETRAQARDRAEQERKKAQRQAKQRQRKEYEDWIREERERMMSEIAEQERLEKQRVKADCEAWEREKRQREVLADRARAVREYEERERTK